MTAERLRLSWSAPYRYVSRSWTRKKALHKATVPMRQHHSITRFEGRTFEMSNCIFRASRLARRLVLPSLLLLAACDIPKDPEETMDRVQSSGSFRVGLVTREGPSDERQERFLNRLAEQASASPDSRQGTADDLLAKLEEGELDLVVGEFHSSSPWKDRVTFVPPLDDLAPDEERLVLAAAARNGENDWIGFLYRSSDVLEGGQ